MAAMRMEIIVAVVLVASAWKGAVGQSNCMTVLISLSPCLDYITGNSSTPSSGCCSQLATVVATDPRCLCEVINNSTSLGIEINQTQAMGLPKECKVETPPVSRCNDTSSPTGAPAGKPGSGGSKTVPSAGGDSSDGNYAKFQSLLPVFLLLITLFALNFKTTRAKLRVD